MLTHGHYSFLYGLCNILAADMLPGCSGVSVIRIEILCTLGEHEDWAAVGVCRDGMVREGFHALPILLVVNCEHHQVD